MALAGWDSNQMIAASKPLLDLAKASDIVTKFIGQLLGN